MLENQPKINIKESIYNYNTFYMLALRMKVNGTHWTYKIYIIGMPCGHDVAVKIINYLTNMTNYYFTQIFTTIILQL